MKQFFKNKFFYIVVVIALIVTIVPMVFYSMGLTFILRDAVNVILTPAQKLFSYTSDTVEGFAAYFTRFDELVEENARLKEEIAELETQIYDAKEIEEMYVWMSNFLEMKMSHTDFKLTAASVIGRESGNYSKVITLDVGSKDGIKLNMPVITSDGLVGQITEVGLNWSKVTTLLESGSSAGAYIERSRVTGVCTGDYTLSSKGLCKLNYVSEDSDVRIGDRVLTSGYGSIYPRGLVIGYVDQVNTDDYSRTLNITVNCSTDYSSLTKVMVVTSFDSSAVDASAVIGEDS